MMLLPNLIPAPEPVPLVPYRRADHEGWPVHQYPGLSGYLHPYGLNRQERRRQAALSRRLKK